MVSTEPFFSSCGFSPFSPPLKSFLGLGGPGFGVGPKTGANFLDLWILGYLTSRDIIVMITKTTILTTKNGSMVPS